MIAIFFLLTRNIFADETCDCINFNSLNLQANTFEITNGTQTCTYNFDTSSTSKIFQLQTGSTEVGIDINTASLFNNISILLTSSNPVNINVKMNVLMPYAESQKVSIEGISVSIIEDTTLHQLSYFRITANTIRYTPERPSVSNYCLCLRSYYDVYVSLKACNEYNVSTSNYYHTQSRQFPRTVAEDPAPIVNIYLPDTYGSSEYKYTFASNQISFPVTKKINFISLGTSIQTPTKVYFDQNVPNEYPIEISFKDITSLRIKDDNSDNLPLDKLLVNHLTLTNTPLEVKSDETIELLNFTSDSNSIADDIDGSIKIKSNFYLNSSDPTDIQGFILQDGSTLYLHKMSMFPEIHFHASTITFLSIDENIFEITIENNAKINIILEEEDLSRVDEMIIGTEDTPTYTVNLVMTVHNNMNINILGTQSSQISYVINPLLRSGPTYTLSLTLPEKFDNLNINGTFNVVLESIASVSGFFGVPRDIPIVVVNCSDSELDITFKPNKNIIANEVTIDTNSIDQLSFLTYSNTIKFTSDANIDEYPNITFIIETNNTLISFDNTFKEIESISNILIEHDNNSIILESTNSFVPLVTINDNVYGVLYSAKTDTVNISSTTNFETENFRTGNDLTINCASGTYSFPQHSILSEFSRFKLDANSNIAMIYHNETQVSYSFTNGKMNFELESQSNLKYFKAKSFELSNTELNNVNDLPVLLDTLNTDIKSIPENSFTYINISNSLTINDNTIQTIILGNSSIRLRSTNNIMTPLINKNEEATFEINTNVENILLSVETNENCPTNTQLILTTTSETVNVHIDKSWFNVNNPEIFNIIVTNATNVIVSTDLMILPEITVHNSIGETINYTSIEHESKYTSSLGFYIFIGITAFIIVLSLVLCFCRKEEMDASSEYNGNPTTLKQSIKLEMDYSSSHSDWNDKKKKNNKNKNKNLFENEEMDYSSSHSDWTNKKRKNIKDSEMDYSTQSEWTNKKRKNFKDNSEMDYSTQSEWTKNKKEQNKNDSEMDYSTQSEWTNKKRKNFKDNSEMDYSTQSEWTKNKREQNKDNSEMDYSTQSEWTKQKEEQIKDNSEMDYSTSVSRKDKSDDTNSSISSSSSSEDVDEKVKNETPKKKPKKKLVKKVKKPKKKPKKKVENDS
ncbi:hypothetical protein GPJ56_007503 [Histomonas meleagridis]|uniref:uncharacterized protein n=1 Tax=Histomonas meleagridis TaxID=135588 RepID=UPI00355A43DF|nr:hypothetical protein GPJ56_007503 [Histomonas meleagridis]KAH0804349.1 hypothetical protein GO595_003179 [Histomonas meleagridis]